MVRNPPSNAWGADLIPCQGIINKIPHASEPKKNRNIKQKKYYNKFNKYFFFKWSTSKTLKKKKEVDLQWRFGCWSPTGAWK